MTPEEEQATKISTSLVGKHVLLGVTGSIAAFKAAGWVRNLTTQSARVTVIMTRAAERFITSTTFSALSGYQVYKDMFAEQPDELMAHITLSREADVLLIAPATAHTIARLAHGMADDLLSTVVLAAKIPVVICPAMNTAMFNHPATEKNLLQLQEIGYHVVQPACGDLACGEEGPGRLPEWEKVQEKLVSLFCPQDLAGKKIVVTAGPTREPLDPARYLSNRSSGKMGYALAQTAARRGAEVTLISGPVQLKEPPMTSTIQVTTARQMHEQVVNIAGEADIIVMAAAVADFKPRNYQQQKIKKAQGIRSIELVDNQDILLELGKKRRKGCLLVGFAAETRDHEAEGRRKLAQKKADLIVVNDILGVDTGFDVETNQVTLVDRKGKKILPLLSKEDTANLIWNHILDL